MSAPKPEAERAVIELDLSEQVGDGRVRCEVQPHQRRARHVSAPDICTEVLFVT